MPVGLQVLLCRVSGDVGCPRRTTTKRSWEHAGIIQAFARGHWDDPSYPLTGPGLYERFRFPLRRPLWFAVRRGLPCRILSRETGDWALGVVKELLATIRTKVR